MLYYSIIFLIDFGVMYAAKNILVAKGDNVELNCTCSDHVWFGPPNQAIYAFENEIALILNRELSVKNEMKKSIFIIRGFSEKNQGNYSCKSILDGVCHYFVKLKGVVQTAKNILVAKGDIVELNCTCSDPTWFGPPNRTIYAVGNEINQNLNGKFSVKNEIAKSTFIIYSFSSKNQGNYSCQSKDGFFYYSVKLRGKFRLTTYLNQATTHRVDLQTGESTDTTTSKNAIIGPVNEPENTTQTDGCLFSNHTQIVMLIMTVTLVAIFVVTGTFKGMKAIIYTGMKIQRRRIAVQNETGEVAEEIRQYDEIDISYFSPTENIDTTPIVPTSETDMHISISSSDQPFISVTPDEASESTKCLAEVAEIFQIRLSTTSTNSSNTSYLNPSRPYMELESVKQNSYSRHAYEKINMTKVHTEVITLAEGFRQNTTCSKRSTI